MEQNNWSHVKIRKSDRHFHTTSVGSALRRESVFVWGKWGERWVGKNESKLAGISIRAKGQSLTDTSLPGNITSVAWGKMLNLCKYACL